MEQTKKPDDQTVRPCLPQKNEPNLSSSADPDFWGTCVMGSGGSLTGFLGNQITGGAWPTWACVFGGVVLFSYLWSKIGPKWFPDSQVVDERDAKRLWTILVKFARHMEQDATDTEVSRMAIIHRFRVIREGQRLHIHRGFLYASDILRSADKEVVGEFSKLQALTGDAPDSHKEIDEFPQGGF